MGSKPVPIQLVHADQGFALTGYKTMGQTSIPGRKAKRLDPENPNRWAAVLRRPLRLPPVQASTNQGRPRQAGLSITPAYARPDLGVVSWKCQDLVGRVICEGPPSPGICRETWGLGRCAIGKVTTGGLEIPTLKEALQTIVRNGDWPSDCLRGKPPARTTTPSMESAACALDSKLKEKAWRSHRLPSGGR